MKFRLPTGAIAWLSLAICWLCLASAKADVVGPASNTPVSPTERWISIEADAAGPIHLPGTSLNQRDWQSGIPTVSEWGLFAMAFLLLTSGAALLMRRAAMRSTPGVPLRRAEGSSLPWFARDVFRKTLAVMLALAGIGFTAMVWRWEIITAAEATGTLVAVGMGTYWVHLLIVSRK